MNRIDFEIHKPVFSVHRVNGTRTLSDLSM
jgi:hypothetical protein